MIKVTSRRTIKPEFAEEAFLRYKDMVEGTRREAGCISYELFRDVNDTNTFVMIEEWESPDNQAVHEQTPHYKKFIPWVIEHQVDGDLRFLYKVL